MSSDQVETTVSEPEYAQLKKKRTDWPFYTPNIDKYLIPETQDLLETYSKIPKDKQSEHVHQIRDQAFDIRAYPCTGLGVWLIPYISSSPAYKDIIDRLKAGQTLLDIGCLMGGDMRQLVCDGAPSSNMVGVDIVGHWDIGFELFKDQDSFKAKHIEADFLSENPEIEALKGQVDIISISAVLHQWDWDKQVKAAKRLVDFSKPGSIIVGHQIGTLTGQPVNNPALRMMTWSHDPASFQKLWDQVGKETGTTWQTKAALHTFSDMKWDPKDSAWMHPDTRVLDFVVTRDE